MNENHLANSGKNIVIAAYISRKYKIFLVKMHVLSIWQTVIMWCFSIFIYNHDRTIEFSLFYKITCTLHVWYGFQVQYLVWNTDIKRSSLKFESVIQFCCPSLKKYYRLYHNKDPRHHETSTYYDSTPQHGDLNDSLW